MSPVTTYGNPKFCQVVFALAVDERTSTALVVLPVAVIPDTVPSVTPASWLIANPVLFVIEIVCKEGVTGDTSQMPPPVLDETVEELMLAVEPPLTAIPHGLPVAVSAVIVGAPPTMLIPE